MTVLSPDTTNKPRVKIVAAQESLISVDVSNTPIRQHEVAYVCLGEQRLKAEVLRIQAGRADLQVFEDTQDVRVGDEVELSGEMLSVQLGPGLLGTIFDGLQNPLQQLADEHGFFLPRGQYPEPLDAAAHWHFRASVALGDVVRAGDTLGAVTEKRLEHRIMVPFDEAGSLTVQWLRPASSQGHVTVHTVVARLTRADGSELEVSLQQSWPVRRPLPEAMLQRRICERHYPDTPLTTTVRIIDTLFPVAKGGTACIPGPFGAGKTVLQSLIARYADVDVVVIVACGERAGEVVETITEFPEYRDPRTGGSLMERTVIICNTSSMPVAARESSIYTGMTIGEYYRQMGYDVLVIADSTSRWAQALRETSGRMEEIPGEEAYPAYLDSAIKNVYERAGVLTTPQGLGSLTMIGTVSPAGGNFDEPVTQATLGTVKTFWGLSYDRAYKRYYPAIDPLLSWSRYLTQLADWYGKQLGDGWVNGVSRVREMLERGETIYQMMQVTGEEGITLDDYVDWQKASLLDRVYLQQDAFDDVDVSTPLTRQQESFNDLLELMQRTYTFADKDSARTYFTEITSLYQNLNYSSPESPEYDRYKGEITALAARYSS
ncbi:MAG: V-type ATP synthase subunit A [Deinococcota bacterium]